MAVTQRSWILARRPSGNDIAGALDLRELPLPLPAAGEVLIRNELLSMDAGTRLWMTAREDSYNPPLPLGTPVVGLALGTVVASRHPDFAAGDLVRCFGQWADHSLVAPAATMIHRLERAIDDPRHYLGVLGPSGWTAWYGVVECGQAAPGETFLVSAAAGALGMLAGQVARARGCRVFGLTGSDEKCRWLEQQLGFDGALNHRAADLEGRLRALCPQGIDLYLENVGGPLLDAVLPNMALRGRVAVCGLVAQYASEAPVPGPYRFDQILIKRLNVFGFMMPDAFDRHADFTARLKTLLDQGRITLPFDMSAGLENVPAAYARLFSGANLGKVLVRLAG